VVAGVLLVFVGLLIGFNTPDAVEFPPGAKAQYDCGSPFYPGNQRDAAACKSSLDDRRGKAETTLVIGGVLVVLGGAIALVQRWGHPRRSEPELSAAS
jgi:hypothetical protein